MQITSGNQILILIDFDSESGGWNLYFSSYSYFINWFLGAGATRAPGEFQGVVFLT